MAVTEIALMLFGNGAELGNFKFFADDLAATLVKDGKFARTNIRIEEAMNSGRFFGALDAIPATQKIKELHVFSHSIGAGLYIGYHTAESAARRASAAALFPGPYKGASSPRIPYQNVVDAEIGGVLTDHLLSAPLIKKRPALRAKFAAGAHIKLWGCNSGVSNWTYSDSDDVGRPVVNQNEPGQYYYWRALNTRHTPKTSIAQGMANYFDVPVYGAGSGAHIEVKNGGKWISSAEYKKLFRRWPGEPQVLRLHPDKGDYNVFNPARP